MSGVFDFDAIYLTSSSMSESNVYIKASDGSVCAIHNFGYGPVIG